MAVDQSLYLLTVTPLSGASPLPQLNGIVLEKGA